MVVLLEYVTIVLECIYNIGFSMICSGENYNVFRDNLNSDMERIQAWIASSRMRLNVQKSGVM